MADATRFTCDQAREALWPDPSAPAAPEARAHYETCPECRGFFRVQGALSARLSRVAPPPAPDTLRHRIRAASGERPPRRRVMAGFSVLALAAVAVLAVLLRAGSSDDMDLIMPFAKEAQREVAPGAVYRSQDLGAVAAWLATRVGRPVVVPEITDAALVGGRVVVMDGMPTAAVLYELHGMPLTYFDVPAHEMAGRDLSGETEIRHAGFQGYGVAVWTEAEGVRAVAAPMPEGEMRAVAEECRNKAMMRAL